MPLGLESRRSIVQRLVTRRACKRLHRFRSMKKIEPKKKKKKKKKKQKKRGGYTETSQRKLWSIRYSSHDLIGFHCIGMSSLLLSFLLSIPRYWRTFLCDRV